MDRQAVDPSATTLLTEWCRRADALVPTRRIFEARIVEALFGCWLLVLRLLNPSRNQLFADWSQTSFSGPVPGRLLAGSTGADMLSGHCRLEPYGRVTTRCDRVVDSARYCSFPLARVHLIIVNSFFCLREGQTLCSLTEFTSETNGHWRSTSLLLATNFFFCQFYDRHSLCLFRCFLN